MLKKQTYKLILQTGDPSSFEVRQEAGPQIWEGGPDCPEQEQAGNYKLISKQLQCFFSTHSSCSFHIGLSVGDIVLAVESHEGTTIK